MEDSRGVKRGKCKLCPSCVGYKRLKETQVCSNCGCHPGKHFKENGDVDILTNQLTGLEVSNGGAMLAVLDQCPLCSNDVHINVNTGQVFKFCKSHLPTQPDPSDVENSGVPAPPASAAICAIEDCLNPCYVDANGTIHECCGYTHAMEHIRRKLIEKTKQAKVVKGVSHCLLPECNRVTWPFMNYCGKTHAQVGKKRGLTPPVAPVMSDDSSLCALPGCQKNKFTEGAQVFDFCGKKHASEARKKGIVPKQEQNQLSGPKDDTMCIIPECTKLKCKDPETGKEHDYCGRRHAEEGKTRNIYPPLTSMPEVEKFLKTFSNLKVVSIGENPHAKPGGVLYKKFITAKNSLPRDSQKTCLAFHGTAEANIDSICANGYDSSKRSGQAHGPGEYFATTPDVSLSYCSGGRKMLLNELLLGQSGVHHTQIGNIIVMKDPSHDLPRFVITFQ